MASLEACSLISWTKIRTKKKNKQPAHESCFLSRSHVTLCMPGRETQGFPGVQEKLLSSFTRMLRTRQPPVLLLHGLEAAGGCWGSVLLLLANLATAAKSTAGISCIPFFLAGAQKATSWIPTGVSWGSALSANGDRDKKLQNCQIYAKTPHACSIAPLLFLHIWCKKKKQGTYLTKFQSFGYGPVCEHDWTLLHNLSTNNFVLITSNQVHLLTHFDFPLHAFFSCW